MRSTLWGTASGPLSAYTIGFADLSSITFTLGGRSFDQNGDGTIAEFEGRGAAPPRSILGARDAERQTTVDYFQLVRVIEVGMDVDGDAVRDLDPSRIYYVGTSAGGNRGFLFLALEPNVRAGVLNVPGAGFAGFSAAGRDSLGVHLQSRIPSLLNSPGATILDGLSVAPPFYDDNLPLRDGVSIDLVLEDGTPVTRQSPQINTADGAIAIQEVIEKQEWARQSGDAAAYAPHVRRAPLVGVPAKSVILQFANGDRQVPNPATTALLRAGSLADRATFVRTNDFFAMNPTVLYPHTFLTTFNSLNQRTIALKAQHQIASFFASDGTQIIDPDDVPPFLSVPIFETPVIAPLPEALNYFP